MITTNANRNGFKHSKVGWIPKDWKTQAISSVADIRFSGVDKNTIEGETPVRLCNYTDVYYRDTVGPDVDFMSASATATEISRFELRENDVLVTKDSESADDIAVPCFVKADAPGVLCGYHLALIRPDANVLCGRYLSYALKTDHARNDFRRFANGVTRFGLTSDTFEKVLIPVPPLEEQHEIAKIISKCDDLIDVHGDLITAKKRQKRALQQQLLTGKKRLPRFKAVWREVCLNDLCTRLTTVAEDPNGYPVLSITAGTGFVSQEDKFSRVIAGKQVENYVLLRRGEFAYNKGNSYRFPQGCVYQLSEYDEGLVPNVFYSFKLNERKADQEFIKQYFLSGMHNKNLYRWINSGVRNNGLLNLNASDFFKLPIDLPPLDEQHAIGDVLRTADEEIKSLNDKLVALKDRKSGLMQKLLTGQVRIKI
jgi:type I restriction enzyme S subunit